MINITKKRIYIAQFVFILLFSFALEVVNPPVAHAAAPYCGLWGTSPVSRYSNMTLYWYSNGATSGSIDQGVGTASPIGSGSKTFYVSAPPGLLTFTLYVSGPEGSSSCTYTTQVSPQPPAATCSIYLSPSYVSQGQSSTVSWYIQNGSSATMWIGKNSSWSARGASVPSGSFGYSWVSTGGTNFDLRVTGPGGSGSCQTTLTEGQPAPPSCSISLSSNPINQGQSSLLSWNSSNAYYFYIQNVGYVSGAGSTWVSPSQSTSYAGTAYGAGGTGSCSGTQTLYVNAYQQCSTPWGSNLGHGSSVTAYQSSSVPYGSSCAAQSETRTCNNGTLSGSYQNSSCTVAERPLPTATISAEPAIVYRERSTTLTWSSTEATSCTVEGGGETWNGLTSPEGGQVTSELKGEVTYLLSCENATATITATTTVRILPVYQEV